MWCVRCVRGERDVVYLDKACELPGNPQAHFLQEAILDYTLFCLLGSSTSQHSNGPLSLHTSLPTLWELGPWLGWLVRFQRKLIVHFEGRVFIEIHKSKGSEADRCGSLDFKPRLFLGPKELSVRTSRTLAFKSSTH